MIWTLGTFPHLTQLSMMRCYGTMTDEILQWICSHLSSLTLLKFAYSPGVTDFGLTGKRVVGEVEEDSGISLKNLKGCSCSFLGPCMCCV